MTNQINLTIRNSLRNSLNIPQDGIVCLTTARLDISKGYQYQLSAIKILTQTKIWSKLYFVWAGKGNFSKIIATQIKDLKVENQVKLLGERSDIPDLLDMADIFI